ncbi:MAG: hypothetical protein GTO14_00070 [Anaerolineales bacterium]|nr:hypothetical protein [Anaerolineales bacterium]
MTPTYPRYPLLTWKIIDILAAILLSRSRSLHKDAIALSSLLDPPLHIEGEFPEARPPGWLIVTNHYSHPGFPAWWIVLAISANIPKEVHWVMTEAWVYSDWLRTRLVTPASRWAFKRVAAVYGLTVMPPMPQRPRELYQRARAVREVLHIADDHETPIIGLAPEGADSPTGELTSPPNGVGRFIALFAKRGLLLLPIGVFEDHGQLCLRIGRLQPLPPPATAPQQRECEMSTYAMRAIAHCLPTRLRGPYP